MCWHVLCIFFVWRETLTALRAPLVRPLQLSLLIWWWGTPAHRLFSGHVLVSDYTSLSFQASWLHQHTQHQLVLHIPSAQARLRTYISHLFIVGLLSLLLYSPGEVVVFQCVELLREHLEEKLLYQGSSGEEEKERECLAGNIAVCKWQCSIWIYIGSCRSI